MPSAILILAPYFEDIEAITLLDVLRRAGIDVTTVSIDLEARDKQVASSHSMIVKADVTAREADGRLSDALLFPGGLKASEFINKSKIARDLCELHMRERRLVCAICAAPAVALGSWGFLSGYRVVHYPELPRPSSDYFGGRTEYIPDLSVRVLVDRNVITSRGPGTSGEFALEIVRQLIGKATSEALESGMMWK